MMMLVVRIQQQEFRVNWPIKVSVLAALLVWIAIGGMALFACALPLAAALSVAFFVLFFLVFVAYYWSMAYVVDEYGVTYRGATEFEHFSWEEIVHVRWSDVPLGGYLVSTKKGDFVLSTFIKGRERLVELIVARAGLFPEAA